MGNTYAPYVEPIELDPLFEVLELMSRARGLLLQGGHAHRAVRKFEQRWPGYLNARNIEVATYHPGRQALAS